MPQGNDSLAWGYILIPYQTTYATHHIKLHCTSMSQSGVWDVPHVPSEPNVSDTVQGLLTQLGNTMMPTGSTVGVVEVYRHTTYPLADEFWYLFGVNQAYGTQPLGASHSITVTHKSATGRVSRLSIYDADNGNVQRVPYASCPSGVQLMMSNLGTHANLVNRYGELRGYPLALTVNVNQRHARVYGKTAAP